MSLQGCAVNDLRLPQSVIDVLPVGISICSAPDARVLQFNRAAVELWGREPELPCDSDECGVFRLPTEDSAQAADGKTPLAWVLETGVPMHSVEGILERADSSRRNVIASIDPILDPAGRLIGAISVLQDITPLRESGRLESEAASRGPESRLQQFMNSGLSGVFHWTLDDQGGCITDANDTFVAMTGYTREEMQSGMIRREKITPPGYEKVVQRAVEQLLTVGVTTAYETEFIAKDGHRVPVLLHSAMLQREKNSGASAAIDLSELHAMREKARLLEAQMVHTQKMEAMAQLAGGIAHDFNNLLMVISGQAELLLEATDRRQIEARTNQILNATASAGQLTRKLLAFSRKQELASSTFDVNQLISGATDLIKDLLPKNIAVELRLSSDPCWIHADRAQMEQTVINLILNARDAMPEGGALSLSTSAIAIETHAAGLHGEVPAGGYALITIADTGQGIPEQLLERIFEPFFTTKPRERGTGLGLSIAQGIVSQSGGQLRVRSRVDCGTTFSVYLPSAERPAKAVAKSRPCPLGRSNESCAREGTILVVDDEEMVRTSVRMFLERYGLKVADCADSDEALRIGSELKDEMVLLITDFMMPKMTGGELAQLLAKQRPELPVIFMSGYAAGDIGDERLAGAKFLDGTKILDGAKILAEAKFLQKPFTRAKLMDAVCQGLETCPRRIQKRPLSVSCIG